MSDLALYDLDHGFPVCALCNKPVEAVQTMHHPAYQGRIYRVYCHGKYEDQVLDDLTIVASDQITFGKAFVPVQIEGDKE